MNEFQKMCISSINHKGTEKEKIEFLHKEFVAYKVRDNTWGRHHFSISRLMFNFFLMNKELNVFTFKDEGEFLPESRGGFFLGKMYVDASKFYVERIEELIPNAFSEGTIESIPEKKWKPRIKRYKRL